MWRKSTLYPIGIVEKTNEQESVIRIFPEYCAGLRGLEGFSHMIVLYWMHSRDSKRDRQTLLVFPRKHAIDVETGVFVCRSPSRPNPIGLCTVKLVKKEGCILTVHGLDALEASPIIDIKPYIPHADSVPKARTPKWANQEPTT